MQVISSKTSVVLTIAGFDPSSGAGITADLKTFRSHGFFGIACITALTVQNTQGVTHIQPVTPHFLSETLNSLSSDFQIRAVKVGMLGLGEIAERVFSFLDELKSNVLVIDPLLMSTSGHPMVDDHGITVLKRKLMPLATVIAPNLSETEHLTGRKLEKESDWASAAKDLQNLGVKNVVITGGHRADNSDFVLLQDGMEEWVAGERIDSTSTHGTGCVFSSAITCNLLNSNDLVKCVSEAKKFVHEAIIHAPGLGHGRGPMNI